MDAYVCDKCGRVVTLAKMKDDMTHLLYKTNKVGHYNTKHLCNDCKDKLAEWFDTIEE